MSASSSSIDTVIHARDAGGGKVAHRPQLIPLLIDARLLLDWQHARKAHR